MTTIVAGRIPNPLPASSPSPSGSELAPPLPLLERLLEPTECHRPAPLDEALSLQPGEALVESLFAVVGLVVHVLFLSG